MRQGVVAMVIVVVAGAVQLSTQPVALRSVDAEAAGGELALTPTPKARCGPGSRPETGIQGRVSRADHESGRAAKGYTCNTRLVGRFGKETPFGTIGGFKVERYVDGAGHDCAYYDTTLMYPTNALDQEGGVNVLDMKDAANPVLTERLVTGAMLTPHESMLVSQKRGLLVAVAGNLATNAGVIDIYDVSRDCRHPVLRSITPSPSWATRAAWRPTGTPSTPARPRATRSSRSTSRTPTCLARCR